MLGHAARSVGAARRAARARACAQHYRVHTACVHMFVSLDRKFLIVTIQDSDSQEEERNVPLKILTLVLMMIQSRIWALQNSEFRIQKFSEFRKYPESRAMGLEQS